MAEPDLMNNDTDEVIEPVEIPVAGLPAPSPSAQPEPLQEVGFGGCQRIVEEKPQGAVFCGAKTMSRKSYCPDCYPKMYRRHSSKPSTWTTPRSEKL
jgi:hypothetical protein